MNGTEQRKRKRHKKIRQWGREAARGCERKMKKYCQSLPNSIKAYIYVYLCVYKSLLRMKFIKKMQKLKVINAIIVQFNCHHWFSSARLPSIARSFAASLFCFVSFLCFANAVDATIAPHICACYGKCSIYIQKQTHNIAHCGYSVCRSYPIININKNIKTPFSAAPKESDRGETFSSVHFCSWNGDRGKTFVRFSLWEICSNLNSSEIACTFRFYLWKLLFAEWWTYLCHKHTYIQKYNQQQRQRQRQSYRKKKDPFVRSRTTRRLVSELEEKKNTEKTVCVHLFWNEKWKTQS